MQTISGMGKNLRQVSFHWPAVIIGLAIFVTLVWTAGLTWLALRALQIV